MHRARVVQHLIEAMRGWEFSGSQASQIALEALSRARKTVPTIFPINVRQANALLARLRHDFNAHDDHYEAIDSLLKELDEWITLQPSSPSA